MILKTPPLQQINKVVLQLKLTLLFNKYADKNTNTAKYNKFAS